MSKRKRNHIVARRRDEATAEEISQTDRALFKKYFEKKFGPLDNAERPPLRLEEAGDDESQTKSSSESEWAGLSQDEAPEPIIEIIEHRTHDHRLSLESAVNYKSFMSSKIPRDIEIKQVATDSGERNDDDVSETINLKHDLELQRLLKESHLLERAKSSTTPGQDRHKTTDLRLQSLGARDSLFHQASMPLAHRKGIIGKAVSREAARRKDAQENGIVLEKLERLSKSPRVKRQRGVDVPSLGRFRNGTLKLSRHDISSIQGPAHGAVRKKKRR